METSTVTIETLQHKDRLDWHLWHRSVLSANNFHSNSNSSHHSGLKGQNGEAQCTHSLLSPKLALIRFILQNVIPNQHFHKQWANRVKTWFDQARPRLIFLIPTDHNFSQCARRLVVLLVTRKLSASHHAQSLAQSAQSFVAKPSSTKQSSALAVVSLLLSSRCELRLSWC